MSPEVNDSESPDQMWLIDEYGGDSSSASTSNSNTVTSSVSLLKLDRSKLEKGVINQSCYNHDCYTLVAHGYMDMKIIKEKRRARRAKCCLLLAILIIMTLCVITLVAAYQIFCGEEYHGSKSTITALNKTSGLESTVTTTASEVPVHFMTNGSRNTTVLSVLVSKVTGTLHD